MAAMLKLSKLKRTSNDRTSNSSCCLHLVLNQKAFQLRTENAYYKLKFSKPPFSCPKSATPCTISESAIHFIRLEIYQAPILVWSFQNPLIYHLVGKVGPLALANETCNPCRSLVLQYNDMA